MQEDEEQTESDNEPNQRETESNAQSERNHYENDDYDYDKKSDTAEDFSEINELAEDLQSAMLPEEPPPTGDNYDEIDEKQAKNIEKAESFTKVGEESSNQQLTTISDEIKSNDNDKELMPPPSVPLKTASRYQKCSN